MARFGSSFLEEEFPDGADGTLFKQELIYFPTSTVDGNPESVKNPYNQVRDTEIRSFGSSKDNYRLNYLIQNNRDRDDYSRLIALGQAFDAPAASLATATSAVMDADNWMRVFALTALTGLADTYNNGLGHNIELYARPRDGKVMLLPWDQDHAFYYSATSSIFGAGSHRLAAVIQLPANRRLFCAHLLDLCQTAFTNEHLDPIITHLSTVADRPGYITTFKTWVTQRRNHVLAQLNSLHPAVTFQITSNNGADFSVAAPATAVEGRGWLDVRTIELARAGGPPATVDVTWLDAQRWRIMLPLIQGANPITLTARSADGSAAGTDSMVITNSGTIDPASPANLRISEIHYHPLNPAEEFLELTNVGTSPIDLTGVRFTAGIAFEFSGSPSITLAPGGSVLVVRNRAAFEAKYGAGPIAGEWSPFTELSDGGDRLTLVDRAGVIIADFSYDDSPPWPIEADGTGFTLTAIAAPGGPDAGSPDRWRPSRAAGGSPGTSDALAASAFPTLVEYALLGGPDIRPGPAGAEVTWTERLGADEVVVTPEVSDTLGQWNPATDPGSIGLRHTGLTPGGGRTVTADLPAGTRFLRLRVSTR
jgi:hypothetical protein